MNAEMMDFKNLARFGRFLIPEPNLLIVRGSIAPVIAGMHAYHLRHRIEPSPDELACNIRELLAATALAAVSLADRESWGWSLTLQGSNIGFFVGIEPEGMICLRVLEAQAEKSSAMVQRQKTGLPMTQSHMSPRTRSPRDLVEQYFSEVVQTRTRLEIREDGDGILVQALPGGNFKSVRDLSPDKLFEYFDHAVSAGRVKTLEEVLLFYECRCSEDMIFDMIGKMAEQDQKDAFGALPHLEVECPRCGRKYIVPRPDSSIQ